ncbi:sulfotransferase domain-containing protein [Lacimicrobium alkaliphilum]|uniref:Sulfotransferase domain-containing protein n=1 Tax=Lacimicrobium alkaliphilum TaxID=1526571 RepID=A0A0U3AM55_9ALTE|nr:sulfotransferase domain-containing protein [Lacimicrobium alkaliphilum]ALS99058.1 hypothetical protein AT746_12820 [Lacimicrobium alkaliphilum]
MTDENLIRKLKSDEIKIHIFISKTTNKFNNFLDGAGLNPKSDKFTWHCNNKFEYHKIINVKHEKPPLLIFDRISSAQSITEVISEFCEYEKLFFNGKKLITPHEGNTLRNKRVGLIAMPKSGSSWLKAAFENALLSDDYRCFGGSWAHGEGQQLSIPVFSSFINRGGLMKSHISPTKFNQKVLEDGLSRCPDFKLILHLRDPRQALVSWIKFEDKMKGPLKTYLHSKKEYNVQDKFEYFYQVFYLTMVDFIQGWSELLDSSQLISNTLITTQEELKNHPQSLNEKLSNWIGLSPGNLAIDEKPVEGELHFRKGRTDEWKGFFSKEQINKLNQVLPVAIREKFLWE